MKEQIIFFLQLIYPFYPLPTLTPAPLSEGFNIGVAQFTTLDSAVSGEEAHDLSNWVYEILRGQIENELAPESPVAVHFLGPEEIGQIDGDVVAVELGLGGVGFVEDELLAITDGSGCDG